MKLISIITVIIELGNSNNYGPLLILFVFCAILTVILKQKGSKPMDIGKAIAHYRKKQGWTMTQLAEESDVTQSAISQYENGKKNPTRETVEKLASAFGITPDELIDKAKSYPTPTIVKEQQADYSVQRSHSDVRFIERNHDAVIDLSPNALLGVRFRLYEFKDGELVHNRPRFGGFAASSPLDSILSKVFAEFVEFHSDEIAFRISEELQNIETSLEEIIRNLDR